MAFYVVRGNFPEYEEKEAAVAAAKELSRASKKVYIVAQRVVVIAPGEPVEIHG